MKKLLTILFILTASHSVFSQQTISADSLNNRIATHFKKYTPELYGHSGLTTYGETVDTFSAVQINEEKGLFTLLKKSELLHKPTENVFCLCHNLLINSPQTGDSLLLLLNVPTTDEKTLNYLFMGALYTGEFGEQMALNNLESTDIEWRKTWSHYLSKCAVYESSIPRINKYFGSIADLEIKKSLIDALMYISDPVSMDLIKRVIDTTKNDGLQAKAIFAYTELSGYDGLAYLKTITPIGSKAAEEKKSSVDWLKKETGPKDKFGTEITNDEDFIGRFADLNSPVINWLRKEHLINILGVGEKHKHTIIEPAKKKELFDLLFETKGFGLEAVKGPLFNSIDQNDMEKLLKLRSLSYYSPDDFADKRANTIGIMIRYLRKQAVNK